VRIAQVYPMKPIRQAKVILGGVGALGNEVLKNLALLGIGNTIACDLDRVEAHNLTRAPMFRPSDMGESKARAGALRAKELNPDINVTAFDGSIGDLGLGAFRRADIVFSTFDGVVPRYLVNTACMATKTPWIDGGLDAMDHEAGAVTVFDARNPQARCYTCGKDSAKVIRELKMVRAPAGCGAMDQHVLGIGGVPTTPMMASIVAGIQVSAALAILTGGQPESDHPQEAWISRSAKMWREEFLRIELGARRILRVRNRRFMNCYHHDCAPAELMPPDALRIKQDWNSKTLTAFEVLETAERDLACENVMIQLPEYLVPEMDCDDCHHRWESFKSYATLRMSRSAGLCPRCGSGRIDAVKGRELLYSIKRASPFLHRPMAEIGIRPLDILAIDALNDAGESVGRMYYELAGDAAAFGFE
jgi:adenylyltransferase/sulfurtransferase